MKKSYNTPEIKLSAILTQDIITDSLDVYGNEKDPYAQDLPSWN